MSDEIIHVTFKVEGRTSLGYKLGKIYTVPLTPLLEAVLRADRDLRLIDPLSIDELKAKAKAKAKEKEKPKVDPPKPKPKATTKKESDDGKSSVEPSPVVAEEYTTSSRKSYRDRPTEESGERSEGGEDASPSF